MADPPPYRTPRWVKLFGIIALALVLLVGIVLLTGVGGDHGPGRHLPSGAAGDSPPSSVTAAHTPPVVAPAATLPSTLTHPK